MPTGTIKWFDIRHGFGFIKPDESTENDLFLHISVLQRAGITLNDGESLKDKRIKYSIFINKKGRTAAENVSLIGN